MTALCETWVLTIFGMPHGAPMMGKNPISHMGLSLLVVFSFSFKYCDVFDVSQ
jgi:hypothetical protein